MAQPVPTAPADPTPERSHLYVYVFLVAAVALAVQVYIAVLAPLAYEERVIILVSLATIMGALVVGYDMRLRYEPRWMLLIPFGALALIFILVSALIATSYLP